VAFPEASGRATRSSWLGLFGPVSVEGRLTVDAQELLAKIGALPSVGTTDDLIRRPLPFFGCLEHAAALQARAQLRAVSAMPLRPAKCHPMDDTFAGRSLDDVDLDQRDAARATDLP
jgi:hypothetical protein